jgi:hypothetical protein
VVFDIRYHPNQGIYFNALVGGPKRAYTYYDMDYWGNCMLQAVEWGVEKAHAYGALVMLSGNPSHLVQLNAERFHEVHFTDPSVDRHHFQLQLARGHVDSLMWLAREPALHQVRTPDGALLCSVTPGPAYGELEARRRSAFEASQTQPR